MELIQMSHIETKSVNKRLRYQLKQVQVVLTPETAIINVNLYLSHLLMDFASIWTILKLKSCWPHQGAYSNVFRYSNEQVNE